MNSDPNVARLQAYTVSVYEEVQEISGQDVGMHLTGGLSVAATTKRWEALRAEHERHAVLDIDSQLVGPKEIEDLCPIMDTSEVIGGIYVANEGNLDPYGSTHALAKSARKGGAEVYVNTMVEDLVHKADGSWTVVTDKGNIQCEHVVNAAGLWAREVGQMAGVHVPCVPMEHHYIVTGDIEEVAQLDRELPLILDLDGEMYLRQERDGVILGVYEKNSTPWSVDSTPWDYNETALLEPRLDDLEDALMNGFQRFPSVAEAGIRRVVNGPFTFTPDGNPLIGPVRGVQNYWSCCGVMAGFSQGCGVALALSQWMIDGKPEGDIFAMDVSRFGAYATKTYTVEKANEFYQNRFHLLCPNEEWPAARPNKVSAFHDRLQQAHAVFGVSYGLETPLWFAPEGSEPIEIPSFRRSNAHEPVGEECRAVRESVGILDITSIAKYEVSGPDAESYMDYLFASRLPVLGRIRMAPLLQPCGHLKGDLTVMRIADDKFMITGSGYLQEFHMMWFEQFMDSKNVRIVNCSNDMSAIAIAGPESRTLLGTLTDEDVDNDSMPFMSVRSLDVGIAPCRVARISFTGELGYEIYVPTIYARSLYDSMVDAGEEYGIRPFGIRALLSLGMEKGFGIWSREFTPEYTPAMCGFDRFVDYEKDDFVGREAALADRDAEHVHKLVGLEIDSKDADAWGYEPVWCQDELAGYVTSGAYGHTVQKTLALAYVKTQYLGSSNDDFSVHILDERRPAAIISKAAYDPSGSRMRS